MTDRIYALSVALADDIRDDDIEPIIQAIHMVKGVVEVKPHVSDLAVWTARARIRNEIYGKLLDTIKEVIYPKE